MGARGGVDDLDQVRGKLGLVSKKIDGPRHRFARAFPVLLGVSETRAMECGIIPPLHE
jgi:hypothetical protein